jgi:hypothetical protein
LGFTDLPHLGDANPILVLYKVEARINNTQYKKKGAGIVKFSRLIFCLLAFALYGSNTMGAVVIIDDNFDDGNIGTNTLGTGNGFVAHVQSDGVNPSTVSESGGNAILSTGPSCSYCISGITGSDTFDFFTGDGARVSWELSGLSDYRSGDDQRPYLVVLRDDYQAFDERLNPNDTNAPGVYIRLSDPEFPAGNAPGFLGGLIVEDGTGAYDELATWSWTGVWDGMSALDIVLDLDDIGFNILVNGNEGNTGASGLWSSIADASGFTFSWAANSAIVGAQNQGLFGIGSTDLDRITVETSVSVSAVPIPAVAWLFGTALIGFVGMSRRRRVS